MSRRKRHNQKIRNLGQQQQAPKPKQSPALNMDYYNAATVVLPEWETIQIVLVGCGGIGGYMAQHLGRLMYVLYGNCKGVNFTLVDPDVVKEENLGRQLFCNAELGQPKSVALAQRYGEAWGLNTMAYVGEFSENLLLAGESHLIVVVGCVDNPEARTTLHHVLGHNPEDSSMYPPKVWWLDCGNVKDSGRVMLGSAYTNEQCRGAFTGKLVQTLPSPALQYPSLLIPQREDVNAREMSCAELAAANLQSLNINAAIAVQSIDMLTRLLITNDLKRYQCAVNVASGVVKSLYCTPEQIAQEIGKPVDFVKNERSGDMAA